MRRSTEPRTVMAGSKPPMRVGEAERTAAQQALQVHLNAGRLGVDEYANRFAAAAGATTAGDLAALFADLPAPHPKLPGGTRRTLLLVAAAAGVAVLAVAGLLAFVLGRPDPAPPPTVIAAPTQPAVAPTSRAVPPATRSTAPSPTTAAGVDADTAPACRPGTPSACARAATASPSSRSSG